MRTSSTPGFHASESLQRLGRIWGRYVMRHGLRYLDTRCAAIPLTVYGLEYLRAALAQPCLFVANHVIHRLEDAPFGTLTQGRGLTLFNKPPDSFIFRRIVREEAGLSLHVVAQSDMGGWSQRPLMRLLQKSIGQSFGKGMLEGLDYIPIEYNPGCFHRTFFQSAAKAIQRGHPILIFPGKLMHNESGWRDSLLDSSVFDGELWPGAGHLAHRFSLPVLPAYTTGARGWRPHQTASVRFGPVFSAQGMTKAEINHAIVQHVRKLTILEGD